MLRAHESFYCMMYAQSCEVSCSKGLSCTRNLRVMHLCLNPAQVDSRKPRPCQRPWRCRSGQSRRRPPPLQTVGVAFYSPAALRFPHSDDRRHTSCQSVRWERGRESMAAVAEVDAVGSAVTSCTERSHRRRYARWHRCVKATWLQHGLRTL